MPKPPDMFTLEIDNRTLTAHRGQTILEVAQQNSLYIPTLCAHRDLTPFGGCRMCLVEVDGMRGLPTACTTPVEPGMVVRTRTTQLQNERAEILQLILSEHTSSCLICEEKDECRSFTGTIRKVGVTTGCRTCPGDGQCELQEVVRWMGITEIQYPIYYRGLRVEKDDPFFDRDHNLCILCGRCVRVCQEVRQAGTLAFLLRGRHTKIGPAFGRTHLEAGCEFCGACISVCPTGALAEKTRKWDGKPQDEVITTCPLCGMGCQLRLLTKGNRVIGALPAESPRGNSGQLCVKGRFGIPELVNGHDRLKKPLRYSNGARYQISWDEALTLAAEKLTSCEPSRFGMLISPECTNEDMYVAQKFCREVMHSSHINSTARSFYGTSFEAYLDLLNKSARLSDLSQASAILCVGLDVRFGASVVGVELKKAASAGAKIVTLNTAPHSLTRIAECWLKPEPGDELDMLRALRARLRKEGRGASSSKVHSEEYAQDEGLLRAVEILCGSSSTIIIIGPGIALHKDGTAILKAIRELAESLGAQVLPVLAQSNLRGSLIMGAYPELLPGGFASPAHGVPAAEEPLQVFYLVGSTPALSSSAADFVIMQNIYAPELDNPADLILPACAFSEINGTLFSGDGRLFRLSKAVDPPGEALPDWQILCRIARRMNAAGFDFSTVEEIQREMSDHIKDFRDIENVEPASVRIELEAFSSTRTAHRDSLKETAAFPLRLTVTPSEHVYRGIPLTRKVDGLQRLFPEDVLLVSLEDARSAGIADGDDVVVSAQDFERTWRAEVFAGQPPGVVRVVEPKGVSVNPNPHAVRIRRK